MHAGEGLGLLTNARCVVPLFSADVKQRRKLPWSKFGLGKAPIALYSERFCDRFATLLCNEAQQRRSAGKDSHFRSISSLRMLGCWPAVPLVYTVGQVEEDRVSSITASNDQLCMSPLTTDENRALEREREQEDNFAIYVNGWQNKLFLLRPSPTSMTSRRAVVQNGMWFSSNQLSKIFVTTT